MLSPHSRIDIARFWCLQLPIFIVYYPAELELYVALPVSDIVASRRLAARSCDTLGDDADPSMVKIDEVTLRDSAHRFPSVMIRRGSARRVVVEHLLPRPRSVALVSIDDEVSQIVPIRRSLRRRPESIAYYALGQSFGPFPSQRD